MDKYEISVFITETEYNNLFPIYIESSININNILLFEKINKSYLMFNNNKNNNNNNNNNNNKKNKKKGEINNEQCK